jgi:hypothetical protein
MFDSSAQISSKFLPVAAQVADDLSGGVGGGFAILSIKGSRFRVKFQGTETPILAENGDPVGSVEAVIIKANDVLTKQFYEKGFTEGDSSPPVCFSLDGKVPSQNSPKIQHANCATCPQNAFGSKVNPDTGKKSKACQDNRKLAIVPLEDLKNEAFGGPMLLRVPAAALKDLAIFGDTLKARGYPYNSVAVRIGFDINVAYPKPIFKAIRPLTDDEADVVLEWYQSDAVQKILADFDADIAPTAEAAAADTVFEQPPAVAPKPTTPPAATVKAPAPPPVAKPAPVAAKVPAPPAAAPKPAAAKPAGGTTFGKKPAAAAAPPPVQAAAEPEAPSSAETVPGNLESDIASILEELNAVTGAE